MRSMPQCSPATAIAIAGLVVAGLLLLPPAAPSARANLLTDLAKLGEKAGGAGGKAAKLLGEIDDVAALVAKLPPNLKGAALAAEALPEGGWRFVNGAGETVTAANAVEMERALAWLVPEASGGSGRRIGFYVTEESAFRYPGQIATLPPGSLVHVAVDGRSYPLLIRGAGEETRLFAEVGADLAVALDEAKLFEEALWQLRRPLGRGSLRVLSLDPDGARVLPKVPSHSGSAAAKAPETVNPYALDEMFRDIAGQTVVVTGKAEGELLRFAPVSGGEKTVVIDDLMRAAAANDVNLVLLQAATPKQPGRKTWLLQPARIADLDKALAAGTVGDFFAVLAKGQGRLLVQAGEGGRGHVRLTVRPAEGELPRPSGAEPSPGAGEKFGELLADLVQNVAGQVVTTAAELNVQSRERTEELERRIVPGIPSDIQYGVVFAYVFGLLGLGPLRRFWRYLLPSRAGEPGRARVPGVLARLGRALLFLLVFMPLVGPFAFLAAIVQSFIEGARRIVWLIAAPFRWLAGRRGAKA